MNVNKEIIKKRTIHVTNMKCDGCEEKIKATLGKCKGIKIINPDYTKNTVYLEYDLLAIKLQDIENALTDINYPPSAKILHKMKRGFIHFTEENEYDNMTIPAGHHCSACGSADSCDFKK